MMNPAGSVIGDTVFDEKYQVYANSTDTEPTTITYKYKGHTVAVVTQTVINTFQVTHSYRST